MRLFSLVALVVFASTCFSQDCASKSAAPQKSNTADFVDFMRNGPTLFTDMDKAILEAKKTGKVVACWVSENPDKTFIFQNPEARRVSRELDSTTVQVAMGKNPTRDSVDRDGKALPARVEFSSSTYAPEAKTAYIPVTKLKDDSGPKILAFSRGG